MCHVMMMIIIIIIIIIIKYNFIYKFKVVLWECFHYVCYDSCSTERHFILNKFLFFLPGVTERFIALCQECTTIMKVWIFHKMLVFIADPRDIEVTLYCSILRMHVL
jgi:hypothetical protein